MESPRLNYRRTADRWDTSPIFAHIQYRLPSQMSTSYEVQAKILVQSVFIALLWSLQSSIYLKIVANKQLPLAFQLQEAEDRNCSKSALLLSALSFIRAHLFHWLFIRKLYYWICLVKILPSTNANY
jgi:hypothetical protein